MSTIHALIVKGKLNVPLLDVFFSMIWFFLFVSWIVLVIRVFGDIFRSDDLGGFAKVIWMLVVMVIPVIGVFIYVIARGGSMTRRDVRAGQAQEEAFGAYVRQVAGSSTGVADDLAKLAQLRDSGAISNEEYAAAKVKLLSTSSARVDLDLSRG